MKGRIKHHMFRITFLLTLITLLLLSGPAMAKSNIYYGKVVFTEFAIIQVKGEDERISVFWMGPKTHLQSRVPFFGDRVRIEYMKDKLGRNAVHRIKVLHESERTKSPPFTRR